VESSELAASFVDSRVARHSAAREKVMREPSSAVHTVGKSKITSRQPKTLKAKIAKAAPLRGMTVTNFINVMLEIAAERSLRRIEPRELTDRDSEALLAMLQKPAVRNAALRKAARRAVAETKSVGKERG